AVSRRFIPRTASTQAPPARPYRGPGAAQATIAASPAAVTAAPRGKVTIGLDVTPKPGIHVYAPGAKDFIPIELKLDAQPAVKAGKVVYPKSETMEFADEKVPVFQKPFRLTNDVTIARSAKSGSTITLAG